ncbi:MAG: type I-B CRISPR-associated endonuclease Cas1b [Patescibacteria group bacterium]|nr:type I-B CRISPR-associated endonuclease Cas1b [Patescibacteria group bacterium]
MSRNYYIFTPGKLRRKDNTIFFEPFNSENFFQSDDYSDELLLDSGDSIEQETDSVNKTIIPINDIEAFYIMTEITLNTKFLDFLAKNEIPAHFFNYYGFYNGTYYPREYLNSGFLIIKQAQYYLNNKKRLFLARKFIEGAAFNILMNLKYYNRRDRDFEEQILSIEKLLPEISEAKDITSIMNIEGRIRKIYYSTFNDILTSDLEFTKREFHPPSNPINALISFCNSLVYTTVISELYRTQLNPTISFLHEPGSRRFSLALDISEVFKPLLADRIIFRLLNTKSISNKDFEAKLNNHYLKESGRKKVIQEYDSKLKTTIKHRILKRHISYQRLVRLECYKLIKHLTEDKQYEPFKIWW